MITYRKLKNSAGRDVWIFCKAGVYFSGDEEQIRELHKLCSEIIREIDEGKGNS